MPPATHATTTTVLDLHVLGTVVRIDLQSMPEQFVEHFRAVWHLCLADTPVVLADLAEEQTIRVADLLGSAASGWRDDVEERVRQDLLVRLTQEVTRVAIAAQAGRLLMFHAGALAHPETGAAIVYVAPGGTGKTTLSRTCGPGLSYVTDECVAVTETGEILPYPKPLSVRRGPTDPTKDEHAPGDFGLTAPRVTAWVAGIVIIRRDGESHESPQVADLDTLDAIELLAPETSSLARLERPLHRLAELIESTGGIRSVSYEEASSLAPLVAEVTGRRR